MADINLGGVIMQIKADLAGLQAGQAEFNSTLKAMVQSSDQAGGQIAQNTSKMGDGMQRMAGKTKSVADEQTLAYAAIAAAATKAFQVVQNAVAVGVQAANEYKAAMMGLQGVAEHNNIGGEATEKALSDLTDEFFDAAAAATALKNLLSRGYTLDQAVQSITRLKDAAAFGRQASYSLRDAVVSATEGIKNENSILVDNAGVTKNVAKMWEDYAKSRGMSTADLTQAQKVEAEYQGILAETAAQVGDLAKMQDSLAGSQASMANQATLLAQAFGEAMTPIEQVKTDVLGGLLETLTNITQAFPGLTAGATSATTALLGMAALVQVIQVLKKLQGQFAALGTSMGWVAGIAAAVGLLVSAYTALKKAQEEATKAEEARKQEVRDAIVTEQARLDQLRELRTRYQELYSKSALTVSERAEMSSIVKELASAYGIEAEAVNSAAEAHERLNAAMAAAEVETLEELYAKQTEAKDLSWDEAALATKNILDALSTAKEIRNQLADIQAPGTADTMSWLTQLAQLGMNSDDWREAINMATQNLKTKDIEATFENTMNEIIAVFESTLGKSEGKVDKLITDWFGEILTENALQGIAFPPEIADGMLASLKEIWGPDLIKQFGTWDELEASIGESIYRVVEAMKSPILQEAVQDLKSDLDLAKQGLFLDSEAVTENWNAVFGGDSPIMSALMRIPGVTQEVATGIVELAFGFQGLGTSSEEAVSGLRATANAFLENEAAAGKMQQAFDWVNASQKAATKQAELLLLQYNREKDALGDIANANKTLENGQTALNNAKKKGHTLSETEKADLQAVKTLVGYQGNNYDVLQSKITQYGKTMAAETTTTREKLQGLEGDLANAAAASNVEGSVQVECAEAVSNLQGLLKMAEMVLAVLSALGLVDGAPSKGGGGGGGGKKDDAEKAAREAERLRKEALEADYRQIEHKRHLNQITFEEELRMLEEIRRKHRLNAEEIMAWEEKIYNLKQEIRQRDAGSIDTIGDALITALEARYQKMLEAETTRLDSSREAWGQWRDDSVKAIEDQIAALDQLAKTEDREKQDQEELRKIAKLRQDIEFEQDEYNRMKLQQQLEQAISAREDRLRRQALDDQKDALRAEIETINERAEAEIKALDAEQKAIEDAYAEQMKSAAIRAEAEQLLVRNNQQEIIDLIGEFAPDYNALGKTLGEKLLDGFREKAIDIVKWFASLNDQLYILQEAAAATAIEAANELQRGYAQRQSAAEPSVPPTTVVNQTVQFYEPVESAGQAAKRIAQTNEELGALLYGG